MTTTAASVDLLDGDLFAAWNAGDTERWLSYFDPDAVWYGQDLRWAQTTEYLNAMQAIGVRIDEVRCYDDGARQIRCETTTRDDLTSSAGLVCESTDTYTLNDEDLIVSVVGEQCPGYATFEGFLISWLDETYPGELEKIYSERTLAGFYRWLVAAVDEFIEESPHYPLEEGRLFPTPTLSTVLATMKDRGVEVYNASSDQILLVEWAIDRFTANDLVFPDVTQIVFPPTAACEGGVSGTAVHQERGSSIDVCASAESVSPGAETSSFAPTRAARGTILHELAHIWNFDHVTEYRKELFVAARGLDVWIGNGIDWDRRGSEHAAEILMWGLMDDVVPMLRLEQRSCADLTDGYQILTGRIPRARVADCSDDPWRYESSD
ncbi:MAG: nuclear transport factor 2 family protein [Actinomycetota bacterium]|nr:nuclear transport factor 2 family protein [Actinomycetota bacterium]